MNVTCGVGGFDPHWLPPIPNYVRIQFVNPLEEINPDCDHVHVFLHLDDDRTFNFDVTTLSFLSQHMEQEGLSSWTGVPPLIVKQITPEVVEQAFKEILDSGENLLNRYGYLQSDRIQLTIGKDEALILFELLTEFYAGSSLAIRGDADRLALGRLGGALDKSLVEPFMSDYLQILQGARQRLLEASGPLEG